MQITVLIMWMMEMFAYQVVDVVAVWYRFMPTARPVLVPFAVFLSPMARCTVLRVLPADRHHVLVDMSFVKAVQVAIV